MRTRLIIAGIGNLIDLIATLHLADQGFYELNPIMRRLLPYPWLFALVKLAAMTAVQLFLWIRREDKHALPLATFTAAVYGMIAVYHIVVFAVMQVTQF